MENPRNINISSTISRNLKHISSNPFAVNYASICNFDQVVNAMNVNKYWDKHLLISVPKLIQDWSKHV